MVRWRLASFQIYPLIEYETNCNSLFVLCLHSCSLGELVVVVVPSSSGSNTKLGRERVTALGVIFAMWLSASPFHCDTDTVIA